MLMKHATRIARTAMVVAITVVLFSSVAALAAFAKGKPGQPGKPVKAAKTASAAQYQYANKATVCHKGKKTISIGKPAVKAHLRHGDTLGACP
jgi:hypothetical protein